MLAATVVTVPPIWVPVVALFLPVLTAVVTKYRAASRVPQALVSIVAAAGLAVLGYVIDDTPGDTVTSLFIAFLTVAIPQLFAYLNFWQPVVKINERTSNTGVI